VCESSIAQELQDPKRLPNNEVAAGMKNNSLARLSLEDDDDGPGPRRDLSLGNPSTSLPLPPPPSDFRRAYSVGPALDRSHTHTYRRSARIPAPPHQPRSQGSGFRLIPIDHGFSLPNPFAIDETELCWMSWPQAKQVSTGSCATHSRGRGAGR
jgi:hypothetical protein